jgi:hypothetical protein
MSIVLKEHKGKRIFEVDEEGLFGCKIRKDEQGLMNFDF